VQRFNRRVDPRAVKIRGDRSASVPAGRLRAARLMRPALLLLLLLGLPTFVAARTPRTRGQLASGSQDRAERTFELMGATCTAFAQAADSGRAGVALDEAVTEMTRLDTVLATQGAEGELVRLNATAATDRVSCSRDLYAAIEAALLAAGDTDGAYDPTIEPLNRVWQVRGNGLQPGSSELADARRLVSWRLVVPAPVQRAVHFLKPGMALDLGGLGRGYALDRAAEQLRVRRVTRALLDYGEGALALSNHEPWQIPITGPTASQRPVVRIALSNAALSTSARSESRASVGGEPRSLVIDPRLGTPTSVRASVTVVTRSAARAAALSAALLVMGREQAFEFAAAHPEIGLLWLEPDGEDVRAWVGNLTAIAAQPGAHVQWMRDP
jgi:FAD:protein FMN transferase